MYTKKSKLNRFYLFTIIVFLATTSFPSFLKFRIFIPLFLPFVLYDIIKHRIQCNKEHILITLLILGCFALFHLFVGNTSLVGTISLFLIFATVIAFAVVVKESFIEIYVYVMRLICYISFIIWLLIILIPGFHSLLATIGGLLPQLLTPEWSASTSNPGVSLYLYYLPESTESLYTSFIRNNGPFFEPGLFASYIVIALVFSIASNRSLFHKQNIIFVLSLLSTCSSAGYISFFLILIYSIFLLRRTYAKVIMSILILICFPYVLRLDFMGDKITSNMEQADQSASSRFGAVIYHFEKVAESPFIGYAGGNMPETQLDRYLGRYIEDRVSPNGLSYCFVFWGVPLALIFYLLLFNGMKTITPQVTKLREKLVIYIIILSAAFSQTITIEPIMLLIPAFSIVKNDEAKSIKNRSC